MTPELNSQDESCKGEWPPTWGFPPGGTVKNAGTQCAAVQRRTGRAASKPLPLWNAPLPLLGPSLEGEERGSPAACLGAGKTQNAGSKNREGASSGLIA